MLVSGPYVDQFVTRAKLVAMKSAAKKITLNVPEKVLAEAQKATGLGITETVVLGLEELRRRKQRLALLSLRGKVSFDLDLKKTRQ